MSLANIRIVLVRTSHPGNIGAAARAIKTMCLDNMYLVAPKQFPSRDASARAAGAEDILTKATLCESLDEAIEDCHLVVGTSGRLRHVDWPLLTPRECAEKLVTGSQSGPVALVFGQEQSGLTNSELDCCQYMVQIPANPDYGSLNLAAAVQVLAYEILLADQTIQAGSPKISSLPMPDHGEMQRFYDHLREVLIQVNFLDPDNPRLLMRKLIRIFNRTGLDQTELNILRGILTAVQQRSKT